MTVILPRRGTAAAWTSANPVLADGEIGFETDTNKVKRGDGVNFWNALPYGDKESMGQIFDSTSFGRSLLGIADAATARTTIGSGADLVRRTPVTVTTTTTLGSNGDYLVLIGASGAPTLPTAVGNTGRYSLKNIDTANHTISTTSSQTIEGQSSYTLAPGQTIDLASDGTNWVMATDILSSSITDSTSVGRAVVTAASGSAARTAIGADTADAATLATATGRALAFALALG